MKVYVSYADRDGEIAAKLAARLAAEGFGVWPDDRVLLGDNWALAAGKALEQASAMVVLLSPDALNSESVGHDIAYALTQRRFANRLICVQLRPTRREPWMDFAASLIDWRAGPESAANDIVKALRARARPAAKRRHGALAQAHPMPEPAGVTS